MPQPVIKVEGLGKRYKLGVTHAGSIRELVNRTAARLAGRKSANGAPSPAAEHADRVDDDGHFWALKDVDFEVQPGEVVGIIGKNGAGKSTLLKILSRITHPTTGRVELHGRVASLLEVGTGFHPELTGRENVYLNGTILGMTKAEVDRQFDAIVDFAGVEKFIDTPVKRYSSGMTVRLGFAVAAHLDPEILIVDEVLAVGDVEFQRRCLGKMEAAANSGKTVLFVSHNLESMRTLSKYCVLLADGQIVDRGLTEEVVRTYIGQNAPLEVTSSCVRSTKRAFKELTREIEFVRLQFSDESHIFDGDADIDFHICLDVNRFVPHAVLGLTVHREDDMPIGTAICDELGPFEVGEHALQLKMCQPPLAPGRYYCHISLSHRGRMLDSLTRVLPFQIRPGMTDRVRWNPSWGTTRMPALQIVADDNVTVVAQLR